MLDKKAYTEVIYIINKMSDEMRNKIPKDVINNIKNKMDKDYKFNIENDDFENVKLLEDTEKILSVLYTDYLATDEEKDVILNMEKLLNKEYKNEIKPQNNNDSKIKLNDIFDNSNKKSSNVDNNEENKELIKITFKEWIKNIFKKLMSLFANKD